MFDSPDLVTPVSTSPVVRFDSPPEALSALPVTEEPIPALERRRRGKLYLRTLAAIGIGLTLLFLWQVLTKI